jgi:hypothetical protein
MNAAVRHAMLSRQGLIRPFDKVEYDAFFRDCSPAMTQYWTMPGDPPLFALRTDFDERRHTEQLRSNRTIVKGRFVKGNVGYVFSDELAHFKALYQKPIPRLGGLEWKLLELLRHEEALSIGQIKDITGLLAKDIAPILHRLQEAFLVYEDQRDGDWERRFFLFESEFPDQAERYIPFEEALDEALRRSLKRLVCADEAMLSALLGMPKKTILEGLDRLEGKNAVKKSASGWMLEADRGLTSSDSIVFRTTHCLHRNDPIVRAYQPLLSKRKKIEGADLLYHILLDGAFLGYVRGHFKNGPFRFEAFVLDPAAPLDEERKTELEAALEASNGDYERGSIPFVFEDLY